MLFNGSVSKQTGIYIISSLIIWLWFRYNRSIKIRNTRNRYETPEKSFNIAFAYKISAERLSRIVRFWCPCLRMLTPANLRNKMDLPGSPLHTTKQSQLDALSLLYPLPEQIWQADRVRPWHTKYGIIVDCNHHDDSWLDKRGQIPFLYPEFLKYCFVKKINFSFF